MEAVLSVIGVGEAVALVFVAYCVYGLCLGRREFGSWKAYLNACPF